MVKGFVNPFHSFLVQLDSMDQAHMEVKQAPQRKVVAENMPILVMSMEENDLVQAMSTALENIKAKIANPIQMEKMAKTAKDLQIVQLQLPPFASIITF